MIVRDRRDFYASAHPTANDVLLVVEVADSSLATDRAIKLPINAREGIPEVWIVDLAGRCVHVYARPVDGTYRDVRALAVGDVLVPTMIDDVRIPVADILS